MVQTQTQTPKSVNQHETKRSYKVKYWLWIRHEDAWWDKSHNIGVITDFAAAPNMKAAKSIVEKLFKEMVDAVHRMILIESGGEWEVIVNKNTMRGRWHAELIPKNVSKIERIVVVCEESEDLKKEPMSVNNTLPKGIAKAFKLEAVAVVRTGTGVAYWDIFFGKCWRAYIYVCRYPPSWISVEELVSAIENAENDNIDDVK